MILIGLVTTLSWIINDVSSQGLFGLIYRYQGLITIWSLIELYFIAKIIINWPKSKKLIIYILRLLTVFYLLISKNIMGNPNFLGAYISILSTFLIHPKINEIESKTESALIIWQTGSRSAALAWIFNFLIRLQKKWIILGVILAIIIVFIFPKKQISSFDNRLIIWDKTWQMVVKKPLFGWGIENYEIGFKSVLIDSDFDLKNIRVDRSHNLFLDILVNSGLFGLVVWIYLIFLLFKNARDFKYPLLSFLIVGSLNVISLNTWILFYLLSALISVNSSINLSRSSH